MMKDKRRKNYAVIGGVILLILTIGATYAYFMVTNGTGSNTPINVTSNTTDSLTFNVTKDITITANMSNFNSTNTGKTQEDSATATATLRANNKTNEVTKNYYLYLNISQNDFVYSINENTPELLLMVKAPGSTEYLTASDVASMSGSTLKDLKYVTNIVDKDSNTYAGFDITRFDGKLTIVDNRLISISTSDTEKTKSESWEVKVVFVNYNDNQTDNGGRTVNAKLEMISTKDSDINIAVSKLPASYGAFGNATATGATATYNQKYNRLELSDITDSMNVTLDYTQRTGNNFATYIVGLATTSPDQGTGKVIHETFTDSGTTYDTGYRYEGKNPNNYVWFNNELWRIIGVFDENSHGKTGKQLVKIMRAESIGGLAWDKSGSNNWVTSSLKALLNGAYLNHENGNTTDYCYLTDEMKGECDYRIKGIQDGYRGMIEENVTWYIGGINVYDYTTNEVYKKERSGERLPSSDGAVASTTGTIGLMYASDFGYGVLADSCDRTKKISATETKCGGSNWLSGVGNEWSIGPINYSRNGVCYFGICGSAELYEYTAELSRAIRPVLYLNDNVKIFDGNGSITNPYIVGM